MGVLLFSLELSQDDFSNLVFTTTIWDVANYDFAEANTYNCTVTVCKKTCISIKNVKFPL